MRFPQSFLDEIRARLPVSHVVARRVQLKRRGREFVGLSPFKQEKTPSFTVNDEKGFYHCFASQEHGDIFTFLMKMEGLSFHEAVEQLAQEAGLPVPKASPEMERRERGNDRLRALMEESAAFFEAALRESKGGQARRYLDQRGVANDLCTAFRVGYAPSGRFELKEHLAAKGYTGEEMAASGMVIAGEDIAVSYDRFRHRIMFPITDLKGRVIAFGGRALDPDHPAKYLNSPETPLFHKGSVLFNAARARKTAHDLGTVLVVEGYMDVMALAGAQIDNTVAPLGTALTTDQLRLLWRMAKEPVLCFDGDEAGRKAAYRAMDTALPDLRPGYSLRFAFLPKGQDPDDLVRSEGAEAFKRLITTAGAFADVLWMREVGSELWDTPERRAALDERIDGLIRRIRDDRVRGQYTTELRRMVGEHTRRQVEAVARPGQGRGPGRKQSSSRRDARQHDWKTRARLGENRGGQRQSSSREPASQEIMQSQLYGQTGTRAGVRETLIVLALINHPWLMDVYSEETANLALQDLELTKLRDAAMAILAERGPLDSEGLRTQLNQQRFGDIVARVERAITHRSDQFADPEASHEDVERGWRQIYTLHRKSVELRRELEAAERALQAEGTDEAFERLRDIRLQLLNAEGMEASTEGFGSSADLPVERAS